MHRTRGKVVGVALAIAATGLLAACGDNDSTASSTPTLTKSSTSAAASSAATSSAPGESAQPQTPAPAPETAAPAPAPETATVAPERPQPVPTNEVPQDTSGLSDKDRKFLDSLKAQGIAPASPDIALSIATYVCQGVAAGASEADLSTFVTAMAGSDPSFDPSKMPVETAGKIYIDTAEQTYCQ
ncbi:DUF732 domain-containing protein [Nocardia noduli]|uniref:DUF732 domain-containing protein n=1 Tax=Nocardia noduli TaxID=2815722 RepID=UPI001C2133BF|nr:DUF732 domain-containing protein [Nocardia noduli]